MKHNVTKRSLCRRAQKARRGASYSELTNSVVCAEKTVMRTETAGPSRSCNVKTCFVVVAILRQNNLTPKQKKRNAQL